MYNKKYKFQVFFPYNENRTYVTLRCRLQANFQIINLLCVTIMHYRQRLCSFKVHVINNADIATLQAIRLKPHQHQLIQVGRFVGLDARQVLKLLAPVSHTGSVKNTAKNTCVLLKLKCQTVHSPGCLNLLIYVFIYIYIYTLVYVDIIRLCKYSPLA